ncbi:MAG: tetratricopeptide repeat protein [Bacteroidales bacterium]|nr:tetratricopeptide repeat protein [Bacteroidales bacterium]
MDIKSLVLAVAVILASGGGNALADDGKKDFYQAVNLYANGMYERARTIFESIDAKRGGDPEAKGWSVLCAVTMGSEGYETLMDQYAKDYPASALIPRIRYRHGMNLFEKEDYEGASKEFASVPEETVASGDVAGFVFRKAYSEFALDRMEPAEEGFTRVLQMPFSDFTAPSRYGLGYIDYARKDFDSAEQWFIQSAKDPRFEEMSNYYILECRFMDKDYKYVTDNGPALYEAVPAERKPHLARIISESYLVLGNNDAAKAYYDRNAVSGAATRSDYFYAGSVLYATGDYKGAVENYSRMSSRTDSLGQIANYHLGYSYIQTKNKVAAMDAFKAAAAQSYNPDIQEDALFNYAKLAFDLNHDASAFDDYIAKYSSKKKGDRIYSYQALACLYNHDYAGAVAAYDNIDELDAEQRSNYMKANYLRANQLIGNGSWRDAVPCLRAATFYSDKNDPFNQLARYWLGNSYYWDEKYDNAVETFTELFNLSALDRHAEGKLLPYNLAYSYFQKEDYESAAKWFDNYLSSRSPMYGSDAAVRRADCDFIRRDYKNAIALYQTAMDKYGADTDVYPYYKTGLAWGLLGDNKKKAAALSNVNGFSSDSPYWGDVVYELGRSYVALKDEKKAIECFNNLKNNAKEESYAARALIELGMIARNGKRYDEALGCYKQVVENMPKSEYYNDALLAIESIYQTKGQTDEYLNYADRVGATAGKTEDEKEAMWFNAAEQMYLSGNYAKAVSSIESYLSKYPSGADVPQAWFYMAECYRNMGKKEQACDWYRKVMEAGEKASFLEMASLNFATLSYGMEKFNDAYDGYNTLLSSAKMAKNRHAAAVGMMRSAFGARQYDRALSCADRVISDGSTTADESRLAEYVKAKSYLATSDRDRAFEILRSLSANPKTDEGAEASYMIIQDIYDQGLFDEVESRVYKFAEAAPNQSYWLAKSFIVLGDTFMEKDNVRQARATFESVKNGYSPSGMEDDVLDNVNMRLEKLQKLSAE